MRHLARFVPVTGDHAAFSLLFTKPDGGRVLVAANPMHPAVDVRHRLASDDSKGVIHREPRSLNTVLL